MRHRTRLSPPTTAFGVLVVSAVIACCSAAATTSSEHPRAAAISNGIEHSCALTRTGGIKCWGYNGHDELGSGSGDTIPFSSTPMDVQGLSGGVTAISAGLRHSCAVTSVGGVKCWGANHGGALGDGTTDRHFGPVDVVGLGTGVIAVAAGYDRSCALLSTGGVKCWGTSFDLTPVDVPGLSSGVVAISAGGTHSCAVTRAGGVKCWGTNLNGQVGDGTRVRRLRPVDVVGFGPPPVKCVVPNVLGKPLAKAKARIVRAHCRVGAVTRVASTRARNVVVGQTPRPGKRLREKARVNLEVSRGRRSKPIAS